MCAPDVPRARGKVDDSGKVSSSSGGDSDGARGGASDSRVRLESGPRMANDGGGSETRRGGADDRKMRSTSSLRDGTGARTVAGGRRVTGAASSVTNSSVGK